MISKPDKTYLEFINKFFKVWDESYGRISDEEKIDGMFNLAINILAALYIDIKEFDKEVFLTLMKNQLVRLSAGMLQIVKKVKALKLLVKFFLYLLVTHLLVVLLMPLVTLSTVKVLLFQIFLVV